MHIYCDESGGVGRGVMTLAAVAIKPGAAESLIDRFRAVTGIRDEVKGSRIELGERAYLFELFERSGATATVSLAISALRPDRGVDRGDHDVDTYARLLEDAVGAMLPDAGNCAEVVIDDGRYGPDTLALIRADIGRMIGPCGLARLEHSHRHAGLQIADVIANSFFNRALVSDRQARMAALLAPFLESGRIAMRVLDAPAAAASPPAPAPEA